MKCVVLTLLLLALTTLSVCPEAIILKNGSTLDVPITDITKDSVTVDLEGIPLTYRIDEIESLGIPIADMQEFDLAAKAHIYALRTKEVERYAFLLRKPYAISEAVFGPIEGQKAWWGILGISYFGNGPKSINGPSEESRFILNPYLLVALSEAFAFSVNNASLSPAAVYPRPVSLAWDTDKNYAKAVYDLGGYFRLAKRYKFRSPEVNTFELVAYNARDLG